MKFFAVLLYYSQINPIFVNMVGIILDELCCLVSYAMHESGCHIRKGENYPGRWHAGSANLLSLGWWCGVMSESLLILCGVPYNERPIFK